jgi:hypothetical protein
MTILNDTESTAVRTGEILAVKKTVLSACPKCSPEKDGEEKPGLVIICSHDDILVLDYETEEARDKDYATLAAL